jgi:peptide/nickel transport system substrate-binding protein
VSPTLIKSALIRRINLQFFKRLENIVLKMNPAEKFLFRVFAIAMIVSTIIITYSLNSLALVKIPMQGGKITEGVVGFPRFVNPLLSVSDADKDLSALIYSGLMRPTTQGDLIPDLAEKYEISEDGLTYKFILKNDIYFHDGHEVSADDVIFTIERALDPMLKSPKRANWEGVEIEKVTNKEIIFKLKNPYAPFIENTTIGILPKHIWKDTTAEQFSFSSYNTEPIGSGPYKIKSIRHNDSGVPDTTILSSFHEFALGVPFINEIKFLFYPNEAKLLEAYSQGYIDAINSISPVFANTLQSEGRHIETPPLPRIFAVFLNHNQQPLFTNKEVRKALGLTINREKIINDVLFGYGVTVDSPLPSGILGSRLTPEFLQTKQIAENDNNTSWDQTRRIAEAVEKLAEAGWKRNEASGILEKKTGNEIATLSFTLATSDAPELKAIALEIKRQWEELGAQISVEIFESSNLNHTIIRTRKYDALLFGEIIGRDLDLFAFWHSSQRTDPGLNIALYTNITADRLLEDARTETNREDRIKKYIEFENEVKEDYPAIFLYTPSFIYIPAPNLQNLHLEQISAPSERFMNVYQWYIKEEYVWPFFIK